MIGGPKRHVFGSVLGFFKVAIGGFMSHVENASSWGDEGWCRIGSLSLVIN